MKVRLRPHSLRLAWTLIGHHDVQDSFLRLPILK
jgi:hypothetical protein